MWISSMFNFSVISSIQARNPDSNCLGSSIPSTLPKVSWEGIPFGRSKNVSNQDCWLLDCLIASSMMIDDWWFDWDDLIDDCWLLIVWLLIVDCWLLIVDCLIVDCWLLIVDCYCCDCWLLQSTIYNLTIYNLQSTINNLQSTIYNLQSGSISLVQWVLMLIAVKN